MMIKKNKSQGFPPVIILIIVIILLSIFIVIKLASIYTTFTIPSSISSVPAPPYGHYFEPHGAIHYIDLFPDKTFNHNHIDNAGQAKLVSGTYTLSNENLTLKYATKILRYFS